MANIMSADLPSEDEEDQDYDPTVDKTAEREDLVQHPKAAKSAKRTRGALLHNDPEDGADDDDDQEQDLPNDPASLAKRRKAMEAWAALNGGNPTPPAADPVKDAVPRKPLNLAALCKKVPKKDAKGRADAVCLVVVSIRASTATTDVDATARIAQKPSSPSERRQGSSGTGPPACQGCHGPSLAAKQGHHHRDAALCRAGHHHGAGRRRRLKGCEKGRHTTQHFR